MNSNYERIPLTERNLLLVEFGDDVHDLKNSAQELYASLELLRLELDQLTEQQKELLGRACEACADISERSKQLLVSGLSRVGPWHSEQCEIDAAIRAAIRSARGEGNADVHIVYEAIVRSLTVQAPVHELSQVVSNVLRNSMQAMGGRGKVVIQVQAFMGAGQGAPDSPDWVEVRVMDNGPGFAEELLPKLFKSFNTTKEHGTGVGLALCDYYIRLYGGEITAWNRPEGGAAVAIRMPVVQSKN